MFDLQPGQGIGQGTSRRLVFGLGQSVLFDVIEAIRTIGFKKTLTTGFKRAVASVQFKHTGI